MYVQLIQPRMHSNFKPGHKQNIGNEVRFEVFIETSWSSCISVNESCIMCVFLVKWRSLYPVAGYRYFLSLITTFSIICAKVS